MQCVILVGGLGTRLGALVADCPKPMLPVAGRPFLDHLIAEFRRFGLSRFLLLAGYRADEVAAHFADDPSVTVLAEPEPLGTGGALRFALDQGALDGNFVMANGDSFLDFNLLDLVQAKHAAGGLGMLAVRHVPDAERFGVVDLSDDGRVTRMRERPDGPGPGLINGGVYVLDRDAARRLPHGASSLERELLPVLAAEGLLHGRVYDGRFIDIGIPDAYAEAQSTLPIRRPAVLFGRDGVLNRDAGRTLTSESPDWMPGAVEAVRLCNDRGWFVFVVTHQAGVADGHCDADFFATLHSNMQAELAKSGAHIDDFRFWSEYPEEGSEPGRRANDWRRQGPRMISDLMACWPIDVARSLLVGDTHIDMQRAEAAGITGVLSKGADLAALVRDSL